MYYNAIEIKTHLDNKMVEFNVCQNLSFTDTVNKCKVSIVEKKSIVVLDKLLIHQLRHLKSRNFVIVVSLCLKEQRVKLKIKKRET